MPTDGSGNYSRPSGTTPSTGDVVGSAKYNEAVDDIATGLSARLMANGSKAATANLPMGGNKVTGLGAATTNGDAVRYEQFTVAADESTPGRVQFANNAALDAEASTSLATHVAGVLRMIRNQISTAANIWAGTANEFLAADKVVDAGAFQTITDGANLSTNMNLGRNFVTTIAGNRAMDNPTNVKVGHVLTYAIIQGSGGSRTITWGTSFNFGDGTATLSTSEGDLDLVSFMPYSSTQLIFLGIRKAAQAA